ncbi:hypothetical protein ACN4EK_03800 [Pantanalinema rosaneae CENA516]|uniref:hypothetical protein n=1 Tax=Pantanalinema rosaneae TaxID=1620701 RepID=UPI003D6FEF1B
MAHWIKLIYDRNTYVIDLDRVTTFCLSNNGRISFPVMDGSTTIVINQKADPATYQALLDYIEQQTGQVLT